MEDRQLDVVEVLLTGLCYDRNPELDENDLPPAIRTALWSGDGVSRPPKPDEEAIAAATGIEDPWAEISGLLFTERDTFSGAISVTDEGMLEEWYLERADRERLQANPTLASEYADHEAFDLDYEAALADNRPVHADPQYIQSQLDAYFDEDDEEMLDLVEVRAPAEIEITLEDLVLTHDQTTEVRKVAKAIEHRDYLAEIGLREIGKLLFVGPPGTGKTSVARGLAHQLDRAGYQVASLQGNLSQSRRQKALDGFRDGEDEHLAVALLSGVGGLADCVDHVLGRNVGDDALDFGLLVEVDDVLLAAPLPGPCSLTPPTADVRDSQTGRPGLRKRFFYRTEAVGTDVRCYEVHRTGHRSPVSDRFDRTVDIELGVGLDAVLALV